MVGLRDDREPAVLEPLDEVDLPQRPTAVQLPGLHPPDELAELVKRAGPGQGAAPDVVADVEVLVVDPDRVRDVSGHPADLLPVPRDEADPPGDELAERLVVE